jgi:protein-disulfide isomerase
MASECAQDQAFFWEYHDVLFENQSSLGTDEALNELSGRLDIDKDTFSACLSSNTIRNRKSRTTSKKASVYGVRGHTCLLHQWGPLLAPSRSRRSSI